MSPDNLFDHGGIDVDTSHDHHVVTPAEDAAFQGEFLAATRTNGMRSRLHEVPGAVAQKR